MKTKILSIISALLLAINIQSCQEPKQVESSGDPKGILSFTAKMLNDDSSENNFDAVIDYDAHTIKVRFPMYYPRASFSQLDVDKIKNVRVTASLATNASISPALTTMDLTHKNYITVTNAQGVKTQYTVTGEVCELWECELFELELASGINCIVDNDRHVVTMLTLDDMEPQTATYQVSPHATITPDIVNEPFDFDEEDAFITVVAQNGIDKQVYTFEKGEPAKIPFGLRPGSETKRWVKRWDELGYKSLNKQTGFGVTNDYLVLNEKGVMQAVVIDAKTGEPTGQFLDMSNIPTGQNHNMTSDNAGHIIVNSKFGDGEQSFKIWAFDGIDDKGKLILDEYVYGAGERVSVYGDITKDAVIVTPLNGTCLTACRWFIKNGVLGHSELFYLDQVAGSPYGNIDIAPTSATNPNADFFSVFYAIVAGKRGPVLYSGNSSNGNHAVKAIGLPNTKKRDMADGGQSDAGNWIMNACDYVEFNKNKYFFHNSVNVFPWGENDMLFLLDVTGGLLETEAVNFKSKALPLQHEYGAMAAGKTGVADNCNDVRLWVDDSGFYMYGYFLFTNGYLGCFRVDCIDK